MSTQDTSNDGLNAESKAIGSSKRKRKSSIIKHNVASSDAPDGGSSQKPIRTYVKKMKGEKGKSGKGDGAAGSCNSDDVDKGCDDGNPYAVNLKSENEDEEEDETGGVGGGGGGEDEEVSNGNEEESKKSKEHESLECKQRCQNCSFCSEHKSSKEQSKVESKAYTCKICAGFGLKRAYNSMDKFKRHTKEVHEPKKEVKRFECTDCPEPVWFPTKSKFCYHLGAKHPGIIKFVCEVCTQTFKLKANYKNHIKTHNIVVQKKFSCDVCGGTFVNRAGYEAHRKRFPGPHIKQSCSRCGVSFSREKHMKNHRCKILLLEEAAAARDVSKSNEAEKVAKHQEPSEEEEEEEEACKGKADEGARLADDEEKKPAKEDPATTTAAAAAAAADMDAESGSKKHEGEGQSGKRVLFHRLMPKKNEKLIYRQFPLQAQNVPQSVVVQEFREIDLEGGAFIAAEPDHQIILRDVNGHLVQGNQILQLDINDFQPGEESQVYLADWNVVAPFVIRGKSP